MQEQKHVEALKEVMETIEMSLKDNRGLIKWQRRLASMLSLGSQHIIELYLHRKNSMKTGAQIKHEWLKMDEKNLKLRLSGVTTKSVFNINDNNEIFSIARSIEMDRNILVYGSGLENNKLLKDNINKFLDLKKIIEKNVGDIL